MAWLAPVVLLVSAGMIPGSPAGSAPPVGPFAVVELFTSEGCSSCPPADRLLAQLSQEARGSGQRIFPLAFHVDYWDQLGWTDRFSDSAYSERQREYTRALGTGSAYTPQMIVNGREEFVGSNEAEARRRIGAALARPAEAGLTLRAEGSSLEAGPVTLSYLVSGGARGRLLRLALVERGLSTSVPRGENAGRTLRHENVVRLFKTLPLSGESAGRVTLDPPPSVVRANSAVIAYVQDPKTMRILGAAYLDLAP